MFGTRRLPFLSHVPDHTDLSPWHPRLARQLPNYDVIHTTDAYFAYARTAMAIGRRRNIPIVNSIHTNTPEYARLFTAQTIERLFGGTIVSSVLLSRLDVAQRMEQRMLRRLAAYQRRCAFVLVSRPEQLADLRDALGGRAGLLRRGIDRNMYHPAQRDRAWLARNYGIPPERLAILAAGRLNRGKNILLLAEAVALLLKQGVDAHLICAGDGEDRAAVIERLGARTSCPGIVEPAELARLYASADLFALPSRIEESANVLFEALASGLPVLVARDGGMGRAVRENETGLVLPGEDAEILGASVGSIGGAARDAARDGARRPELCRKHGPVLARSAGARSAAPLGRRGTARTTSGGLKHGPHPVARFHIPTMRWSAPPRPSRGIAPRAIASSASISATAFPRRNNCGAGIGPAVTTGFGGGATKPAPRRRSSASSRWNFSAFHRAPSRRISTRPGRKSAAILAERTIDTIWVPAWEGGHQDHDVANFLASRVAGGRPVIEFAEYNRGGGTVLWNRFAAPNGGEVEVRLDAGEIAVKRRLLTIYASEKANLAAARVERESSRPLPAYDYTKPPHAGRLLRERFHWVGRLFRHPRVDFEPSQNIYDALKRYR